LEVNRKKFKKLSEEHRELKERIKNAKKPFFNRIGESQEKLRSLKENYNLIPKQNNYKKENERPSVFSIDRRIENIKEQIRKVEIEKDKSTFKEKIQQTQESIQRFAEESERIRFAIKKEQTYFEKNARNIELNKIIPKWRLPKNIDKLQLIKYELS